MNNETGPLIDLSDDSEKANKTDDTDTSSLTSPAAAATKDKLENEAGEINFLNDSPCDMTWARRIALSLQNKKWYNPQALSEEGEEETTTEPLLCEEGIEKPSLEKAWAFFEHFTLPRYIYRPEDGAFPEQLDRAEPGEKDFETKLYSPWTTPLSQMGDFGIGIGLYFSALRSWMIIMFIAGILSLPNMIYFASSDYDGNSQSGIELVLHGSAICTDTVWVPCPSCSSDKWNGAEARFREDETGKYALKNNCSSPPIAQGLISWITIIFLVIAYFFFHKSQSKMRIKFDEDELTAKDYSLQVENPPPDAFDPEEWKAFFEQFGPVRICTVCLNNDELLQALAERRDRLQQMERLLPPNTSLDYENLTKIVAEYHVGSFRRLLNIFLLYPFHIYDVPGLYRRINTLNEQVNELGKKEYIVTSIFITFDTETAKRSAMTTLSAGSLTLLTNNTRSYDAHYLFRNNLILQVTHPEEPSAVIWENLNMSSLDRLRIVLLTIFATLATIVILALIVKLLHEKSAAYASTFIAISNMAFPLFGMALTNLEAHGSESHKQTSLFMKIALFRWVNTVIVIDLITPFVYSITEENQDPTALIPNVYGVFIADLAISNSMLILDPIGHFKRHYLGPRSKDQDKMNLCFVGKSWKLAERYTNMTKIIFLCFYYSAIYPAAFFFCSFSISVMYFVDSFCIMRSWGRVGMIGPVIGKLNDKLIMPLSLLALCVIAPFWWSAFPMDNLCLDTNTYPTPSPTNSSNSSDFVLIEEKEYDFFYEEGAERYFNQKDLNHATPEVMLSSDLYGGEEIYKYCDQAIREHHFPPNSDDGSEWMTDDQKTITDLFGVTSVILLIIFLLFFLSKFKKRVKGLFISNYKPEGEEMNIDFMDLVSYSTYVPQVQSNEFAYPLVAVDTSIIDDTLYDWQSDHSYSYYDLTIDMEKIIAKFSSFDTTRIYFSTLKYWPVVKTNKDESDL